MAIKQEQNQFNVSWTTQRLLKKSRSSIPTKGNLMLPLRVSRAVWDSLLTVYSELEEKRMFQENFWPR
jgi:hypothetical protein